jgi:hypothetical protein
VRRYDTSTVVATVVVSRIEARSARIHLHTFVADGTATTTATGTRAWRGVSSDSVVVTAR